LTGNPPSGASRSQQRSPSNKRNGPRLRNAKQKGGHGKCAACSHPQLAEIDAGLVAEIPYRQLAARFGISPAGLLRHKRAHLGQEVVALAVRPSASGESALVRVERLYDRLERLLDEQREVGVVLAVARELGRQIELLAKLSGELNERPQQLTVNLLANDQFMEALKVISDVLTPYPEAKRALVARLRALNEKAA